MRGVWINVHWVNTHYIFIMFTSNQISFIYEVGSKPSIAKVMDLFQSEYSV